MYYFLGDLYVVVDFCKNGSLDAFLKKHRLNYINELLLVENNTKPVSDTANLSPDGYLAPNSLSDTDVASNCMKYKV